MVLWKVFNNLILTNDSGSILKAAVILLMWLRANNCEWEPAAFDLQEDVISEEQHSHPGISSHVAAPKKKVDVNIVSAALFQYNCASTHRGSNPAISIHNEFLPLRLKGWGWLTNCFVDF